MDFLATFILLQTFKIKLFSDTTSNFFKRLVLDTMEDRELRKILRPDMIHLLMEAKKGNIYAVFLS